MKRLPLALAALALTAGLGAGCSKSNDTTTASNATVTTASSGGGGGAGSKTLADAQQCADMAAAYAGLFTPLMTGADDATKAKVSQSLDDMKSKVPDNIATDMTKIQDALKSKTSLLDLGTYLSSAEFTVPNGEVTTYLTTECGKVAK